MQKEQKHQLPKEQKLLPLKNKLNPLSYSKSTLGSQGAFVVLYYEEVLSCRSGKYR